MRWRVELLNVRCDRRLLADVFRELSMSIFDENGEMFLSGEMLETFETPADVRASMLNVQNTVRKVCDYNTDIEMYFSVGNVLECLGDSSTRCHYFLEISESVHAHSVSNVTLSVPLGKVISDEEQRNFEEVIKESDYQQLRALAVARVVSALIDPRALTVQRLLSGEPMPQELGHVADIIQDDLRGDLTELASKGEWSRFYRSINHPDVFGESARHIVSNVAPPPNPMNLNEARSFIYGVADKWLTSKSSSKAFQ